MNDVRTSKMIKCGIALDGIVAKAIAMKEEETGVKVSSTALYEAIVTITKDSINVQIESEDIDFDFAKETEK